MINVRELKLKKVFHLKEYLEEKARQDKEYNEYVDKCLEQAEEDFREGRFCTLEEFKRKMEEEFGLRQYE